nr:hypothetical protein [Bifidobacterium longum]
MDVINNAHGELMMAGAYTAYAMSTVFASKTLALGLALVVARVLDRSATPALWLEVFRF